MCSLERLSEARLLSWEAFQKFAKCGIGEANVNSDNTLNVIKHLEHLIKQ